MPNEFDVIVVGAGPAGLAAARVVAEAGLSCVAIDKMGPGGRLMNIGEVHDYPDAEPGSLGPDLIATLAEATMTAGVEFAVDEVIRIAGSAGAFVTTTHDGSYRAKAVIVATGLDKGTTGLADEARFEGQGISHCAMCDGPLYEGRRVVVVGSDRWAAEEAIALAATSEHVTLVTDGARALFGDAGERLAALANVEIMQGRITALAGAAALEAVTLMTAGRSVEAQAAGLFVFSGRRPAIDVLGAMEPAKLPPGLISGGTVRDGCGDTLRQAIADGVEAGHNAVRSVKERAGAVPQ